LIDVCIVTYRNEETIGGVLGSVEEKVPGSRVSIWDNSPDQGTTDAVNLFRTDSALDINLHGDGTNIGFGHGCNQLAHQSREEWLMFLNPDAMVGSWPGRELVFQADHVVGPVVQFPDGVVQETFGQDRSIWREIKARILRLQLRSTIEEGVFETDFVSGAAFLVDRARFLESGGFDANRYFMYYEDLDFCRRWRLAGGKVQVDPSWRVSHIGGFSARSDHALALVRSFKSARAYHRRWSAAAWLFRPVCIVECLFKLALAVPRRRVGGTGLRTQLAFCRYLVFGHPPAE